MHKEILPVIIDGGGNVRDLSPLIASVLRETLEEGIWSDSAERESIEPFASQPIVPSELLRGSGSMFLERSFSIRLALADRDEARDLLVALETDGFAATAGWITGCDQLHLDGAAPQGAPIAIELGAAAVCGDWLSPELNPFGRVLVYGKFQASLRRQPPAIVAVCGGRRG